MTRDTKQASEVTPGQQAGDGSPALSRRPYKSPVLRHLGSVRELTLGTSMGGFDDKQGQYMVGPM